MALCTVTGTLYNAFEEVVPNATLYITPLSVAGMLMSNIAQPATSDENGLISFQAIQGASYKISGVDILNYEEADGGANVTIPPSSSTTLEALQAIESYPLEGLTAQSAGVPYAQLVGTINVTGAGQNNSVAGGVWTINIPGGTVASVFEALGDTAYADASADPARLAGNITTTRKFMRQVGNGTISAAPAWDTLLAADIPALAISGITGLQTALDGKQATLGYTAENQANKATDFLTVNHTLYPTVQAAKAYADSLVVGLLDDRGNYDASGNVFPSSGGSGTAGAVLKGDLWIISVAGTLGGNAVTIGDQIRALVDSPGQTAGNWAVSEANIGYVPENVANKATGFGTLNNTLYPTTQAVANYAQPLNANLTQFAALTDPNADRLLFWDDSAGAYVHLALGTNLSITGTTLDAAGGSGANAALSNLASVAINTSLLSDTDNTDDLGSSSIRWKDIYGVRLITAAGSMAAPAIAIGGTGRGIYNRFSNAISFSAGSALVAEIAATGIDIEAGMTFGWGIGGPNPAIGRVAAGIVEIAAGAAGTLGKLLAGRVTANKTSDYTVLVADKSTFFTNAGAVATVNFTLPTAAAGLTYEFYRDANQTVQITAAASTTIRVGTSVTAAAGNVTLDAVGSRIRLVAISATQWVGDITGAATFT